MSLLLALSVGEDLPSKLQASRESMGTGKGEGASVDEQQSSGKDSRWSPKSSQLAKASSMSMSSFGSARVS